MASTPGTLVHHEIIDTGLKGADAHRVRYTTHDVNGRTHEASGLVIAPSGAGSDRPVFTWGHGTTGLGDAACPSAQPDPARELVTYFDRGASQQIDYGIPGVQAFIDDGWVVCATDYQGLGTPGMHQYMVSRSNARDTVNIVHAARALDVGAGVRVGCSGWSQGGGTAAAVAELDPGDYGELRVVGTAPMSPGVASVALASPTGPAAALTDPTTPPDSHLVMLLCGIQAANPDRLALDDVFTPLGVSIIEQGWNTQPVHHLDDTIARFFRLQGAVLRPDPQNFDAWTAAIVAGSAAGRAPICPVLVTVDSFGGGTVVPVGWQDGYIEAVEHLGGNVERRDYPDDDHFSLPGSCIADVKAWLTGRLGA